VASELDFRHVSAADGDGTSLVAPTIEELRANFNGNPVATFFGEKRLTG